LEHQIRVSLGTLFSRKEKTVYPDPNESSLLTLFLSTSTLHSLALPDTVVEAEAEIVKPGLRNDKAIQENTLILSEPQTGHASLKDITQTELITGVAPTIEEADVSQQDTSLQKAPSTVLYYPGLPSDTTDTSDSSVDEDRRLIQGQVLSQSIRTGYTSRFYTVGALEIQLESPTEHNPLQFNNSPKSASYSIEWLTVHEAERVQEHQAISVIQAESIEGEISREVDESNTIYIAAKGSMLRLVLHLRERDGSHHTPTP
jgi:hypothetical protein